VFVLVVTGKKELADDKAVLLSNPHHGLRLLKLKAGCIRLSARPQESAVSVFCSAMHSSSRLFADRYPHVAHVYAAPRVPLGFARKRLCSFRNSARLEAQEDTVQPTLCLGLCELMHSLHVCLAQMSPARAVGRLCTYRRGSHCSTLTCPVPEEICFSSFKSARTSRVRTSPSTVSMHTSERRSRKFFFFCMRVFCLSRKKYEHDFTSTLLCYSVNVQLVTAFSPSLVVHV